MKYLLFFLFLGMITLQAQPMPDSLKVITLNIRYDEPADGPNAWPNRREIVKETILQEAPQFLGLQEAQWHQLQYLDSVLTNYAFYGVSRDDGKIKGEFSPIFYQKDRFVLLFAKTFWLSDNPEQPGSIAKGALFPRLLTLLCLYDLQASKKVWVANTHFSHVSDSARLQAMQILLNTCRQYANNQPLIIMGDFNAEHNSPAYQLATQSNIIPGLKDTFFQSQKPHHGGQQTFNAFGTNKQNTIIDHIFCNSFFMVQDHYFLPVKRGNVYISDHFPVVAILKYLEPKNER